MVDEDRPTLLKDARKEGVKLRAKHRQNDRKVLENISLAMNSTEIGKRKRKTKVSDKVYVDEEPVNVCDEIPFVSNSYVAVAYQDSWYTGWVEKVLSDNDRSKH